MFDGNDDARVESVAEPIRRRWSAQAKARIVEETLVPGARLSEVARRWQVCPQQIYGWRRSACQDVNGDPAAPTGSAAVGLAHGLAALAQEVLAADPFSGAVIVYRAKRSDRVKILVWDSSGLILIWK